MKLKQFHLLFLTLGSAAACAAPSFQTAPVSSNSIEDLGKIDFPNSGAAEAQSAFIHGVLLLHSFEYEDAAEAFREAQSIDPSFALAYWGESLTYSHPIWNEDSPEKAREALNRLAPNASERLAKAQTEREKCLVTAVEHLWGDGKRIERNRAYAAAMEQLYRRFPDDLEIASFTSLAILGTCENGRDIPTYMRAAAIVERVYQKNPDHPGGLHYAIHAYDDPVHAPLGLRMAERYAEVAPAAQHALHMPSHIFVALGMWEESAATNEASVMAADERRARKGLGVDARGYHSLAWLSYSYLQLGRIADSRRLVERMAADVEESGGAKRSRSSLASMQAAFAVDAETWECAPLDTSELPLDVVAAYLFVRGVGATERDDLAQAETELEALGRQLEAGAVVAEAAGTCCRTGAGTYGSGTPERKAAEVMQAELEGILLLRRGEEAAGLDRLRAATQLEDAMGFDFGPPAVVKPAHELLGEALLERGEAAAAEREFEAALARAPRRARSLLGLARAQEAVRDAAELSSTQDIRAAH